MKGHLDVLLNIHNCWLRSHNIDRGLHSYGPVC